MEASHNLNQGSIRNIQLTDPIKISLSWDYF